MSILQSITDRCLSFLPSGLFSKSKITCQNDPWLDLVDTADFDDASWFSLITGYIKLSPNWSAIGETEAVGPDI